jgi:hypothetical protein
MNTLEWVEENPGFAIEIGAVATGTTVALIDPFFCIIKDVCLN